jgi:hypothetical protein
MDRTIAGSHAPYIAPLTPVYVFLIFLQESHLLLPITSKDGRPGKGVLDVI